MLKALARATVLDKAKVIVLGGRLILPDDVRGDYDSLEKAVLTSGWPRLEDMGGKMLFVLNEKGRKLDAFRLRHAALRGRVMFVEVAPGTPEAAFHIINDPVANGDSIRALVDRD